MTITAEQIPDEVARAARVNRCQCDECLQQAKAGIARALNAWPKAFSDPVEGIGAHNRIVLPLPRP